MATEIIDKEIFQKTYPTGWQKARLSFYFLVFFFVFAISFVPVPFAPEILHDIFGGKKGGLTAAFIVLFFIFVLGVLFSCLLYRLIRGKGSNKQLLTEITAVSTLFIFCCFLSVKLPFDTPQSIVSVNINRQPEDFSNPYLSYKMLDCRNISENFDVIFIPRRLSYETEYLAYAPRRKDKTLNYRYGRKFGDDWYLDYRGSGDPLGNELIECEQQNKSPNN